MLLTSSFCYIFDSADFALPSLLILSFYVELIFIFFLVNQGFHVFALVVLLLGIVGVVEYYTVIFYGEDFYILHEIESLQDFSYFLRALDYDYCPLV